jgi:hypothetical protein
MSLQLAIAINVIADLGLLAGLAYATSLTTKLTPHFREPDRATTLRRSAPHIRTRLSAPTSTAS